MIATEFIVLAFRIINFGVLIALLGYLFKKYALSTIQQRMLEKRAYVGGLQEQYRSIIYQQEQIAAIRKEEELLCQRLQQQVSMWRFAIEKERKIRLEEKEQRKDVLKERAQYKEQQIRLLYLKKQVIPHAVRQAEEELQRYFSDKQAGNQYVQQIITRMR